jgi:hypothetical protein
MAFPKTMELEVCVYEEACQEQIKSSWQKVQVPISGRPHEALKMFSAPKTFGLTF